MLNTCEVCSTEFKKVSNTSGKFCSTDCYYKSRSIERSKPCEWCHKIFDMGVGRSRATKCCSIECANKYKKGLRNPCKHCGKLVKLNKHTYCSRTCSMLVRNVHGGGSKPIGYVTKTSSGYISEKVEGGWMMQHRLRLEVKLGRKLEKRERVHHKNGVRDDNRPENLELWTLNHKDPAGVRMIDLVRSNWNKLSVEDKETLLEEFKL